MNCKKSSFLGGGMGTLCEMCAAHERGLSDEMGAAHEMGNRTRIGRIGRIFTDKRVLRFSSFGVACSRRMPILRQNGALASSGTVSLRDGMGKAKGRTEVRPR